MHDSPALADKEPFITLLVLAGEEGRVRDTLRKVLALPEGQRRIMLRDWTVQLHAEGAPADLIAAVAALADERVAWRVNEALFAGRFNAMWPPYTKPRALGRFGGYALRGRVLPVGAGVLAVLAVAAASGFWLPNISAMDRVIATVTFAVGALLLFSASDV